MSRSGPLEASADMRVFAALLRQMHIALLAEGFTEAQALGVIGQCIFANIVAGGES